MLDISKTCGFTGYRPEKQENWQDENSLEVMLVKKELRNLIKQAAKDGYTYFISGVSRGFDLWAAEEVLKLSKTLDIHLVCAVPFTGQEKLWNALWKQRYYEALRQSRFSFNFDNKDKRFTYFERNRFIVDNSSLLICYFDGTIGGTAYTYKYAKKKDIKILNIADGQESLF